MQIETFKILADLVETTSFSEAAERNGMTQSAVSQHIKVIEERFNVLLVERGRKQFSVTPEGEIFLKAGAEILQVYSGIWNELELLKNTTSGTLKIATVFSIGFYELPPYVEKFREAYPELKLEVKYRANKEVYDDILNHKADLGLVPFPVKTYRGIEIEPAWNDRLVVICSPNHKLAQQSSMNIESLEGERLISYQPDQPMSDAVDNIFLEAGVSVDKVMVFDNIETVKRGVEIEGAFSVVPEANVKNDVQNGILHQIILDGIQAERPLGILRRSNKTLTRSMEAMIEALQN